jgi:Tfp pilus assembly protein PilE
MLEIAMRKRQRGMTLIGLLCVLALVGAIGYAGILLFPVYLNYMKVVRSMQSVAAEFKSDSSDQGRMRVALEKRWDIEDISLVKAKDVEIKRENDVTAMHVNYDHTVSYIGNVSLLVSFDKTVTVQ